MEMIVAIALLLLVFGGFAVAAWDRYDYARAMVLGELGRLHATQTVLSANWFDADRDTVTFDVQYVTADGRRHHNRCVVPSHPAAQAAVYWERPLQGTA